MMGGTSNTRRGRSGRRALLFAFFLFFQSVPIVFALDLPHDPDDSLTSVPLKAVQSVYETMRKAISSYALGDKANAMKELEVAADQGHAPAHWKLARMYAEGDGVQQDDAKAFRHFSLVCDGNAETAPNSPDARFVASSFVALGNYYLNGISNSAIKANPVRSRELYTYAATYFGDPEAQYRLAGLYLEGIGGSKDPRQAIRWLNLSAEKGYRMSQAKLGALLFSGQGGERQRARGLMWLNLARDGADPEKEHWIIALQNEALEKASDSDKIAATAYRAQFDNSRKK